MRLLRKLVLTVLLQYYRQLRLVSLAAHERRTLRPPERSVLRTGLRTGLRGLVALR